jgi:serine O-acetyltransferase
LQVETEPDSPGLAPGEAAGAAREGADRLWHEVIREAEEAIRKEKHVASFLKAEVLSAPTLEAFLAGFLASRLESKFLRRAELREMFLECYSESPKILADGMRDILAIGERDPACRTRLAALLFYKGFHALQGYRISHHLWTREQTVTAAYIQHLISERMAVDIHPAARIGAGIFIDHGTGLVIGETAVVEDTVSILHEVTLGGTGKQTGDRHPKVRTGVLIGAGAKILGNVVVGEFAKVGAGSVVLKDVPPHTVVAGVPARILRSDSGHVPAVEMNQGLKNGD